MTTIGYATLQIIPSLKGVSEAINKEIQGKAIEVKVAPKVDERAAEQAGKKARETVEKQTTQVKVEPKVDQRAAERTGKATGEAVTKGANEAVRKGDIGGTVSDEIRGSVEKSSPGRELGKILVDGIADGVKGELRGGPLADNLIDGIADGVKQGIDNGSAGKISDAITGSIKSGNLTGKLREAVLGGINQVGTEIHSSTADWGRNIAASLRSGDIEGATSDIGTAVLNTTSIISNIGETFGLQLGGVREFGQNAATTLSDVGGDVQDVVNTALSLKNTFTDVGGVLETVLPGKAKKGAELINAALALIVVPQIGKEITDQIDQWLADNHPTLDRLNHTNTPDELGRKARKWVDGLFSDPLPDGGPIGTGNGPHGSPVKVLPDGTVVTSGHFDVGGYTGNWARDQVAGVVHGDEFVVRSPARRGIENAFPGLLDYMNKTGKLPGYEGGGLVLGDQQLSSIIKQRFGINDIGGWRPQDKYGEHSTGRALDVMVGNNRAKGDAVKDFVLANADAVDLKWVIWRQHLFRPGGGGYDMEDRGSPTQNHMDHVHIFSGTGITNGLRGALAGGVGGSGGKSLVQAAITGPGAIDPSSTDQTASSAAATPSAGGASSSTGGIGAPPSSLSGLSRWGLDSLGAGVGKTGSGSDLSLFGKAAGDAVSGQVSSALGVLGVGDSPGWLKGISTFVSGLSVSDKGTGRKLFDGGNIGASFGGSDGYGGAAPVSVGAGKAAATPDLSAVHGGSGGRPPGPTWNTTFITNDDTAYRQHQQYVDEQTAAQTNRWG